MKLETNDLATLPDLNEETLLEYLKTRYTYDIIYVILPFVLIFFTINVLYDKKKNYLDVYWRHSFSNQSI
jgi:myosin heavy subunit